MTVAARRVLGGPVTIAVFAALVTPFALGRFETSLMSPLAMPGYLLFVIGTKIGNALTPRFAFWLYWVPFLVGCYAIAVVVSFGYELHRTSSA